MDEEYELDQAEMNYLEQEVKGNYTILLYVLLGSVEDLEQILICYRSLICVARSGAK